MTVKFRDLYDAIRNTEEAYERMGVDIESVLCGMPKCVLSEAQERLIESYLDLCNIDVDFCELDFQVVIKKMEECFECINDEFSDIVPSPLPKPAETVERCSGSTVIPLEHIKRFRIYERTYTSPIIPSPVQVYVVSRESLPYTFKPSVPESVSSHEMYHVAWNHQSNALRVKADNDQFPESSNLPNGCYNIVMIVAEIDDKYRSDYGVNEVTACKAMLITPGVKWKPGLGLENAVDNSPTTYTAVDGTPPEVVVEFQFIV
jgi:hypothetical protein